MTATQTYDNWKHILGLQARRVRDMKTLQTVRCGPSRTPQTTPFAMLRPCVVLVGPQLPIVLLASHLLVLAPKHWRGGFSTSM